ncbi:DUF4384 domain-containing protein [Alphaproteobacteria bacterium GH1-50]|uniref:DUF4384 domain-containing protein n=1 Tax=Kangsaoukella pontilimi TaxID=2691042 RepID=A0A7C9IIJ1_9RHOB|nr:caspase family protein [Kangsaoukella pontilimi]MXQ09744.1 DUF4384 domain-containing protein [Kangsaoukella pontilimi]
MMRRGLAALLAVAVLAGPASAERMWGLVIGIDDYAFVPDLHGAVNDARDIADALEGLDAEVTLLLDGEATRAAIFEAWRAILDKASPGDRLVVSFAGHGSNEPEAVPGSEEDGRDENFLLSGFAPRGPAAGERIRDDEIAGLLSESAGLRVIFVADACHAGTVTRNVEPALGYRYVDQAGIEEDPLPPPPPNSSEGADVQAIDLFLAAVREEEKVPEVMVDGAARGALSYAFADGLRGGADFDRNGIVTKGELELHVRRTVRRVSDGVQAPQSSPTGAETRALVRVARTQAAEKAGVADLRETGFGALPPVTVTRDPAWSGRAGILENPTGSLRMDGRIVRSAVGDVVAVATDGPALQSVIDTHRLAAALKRLADPRLDVRFDRGDRTYRAGTTLGIEIEGRATRFLTLVSIAPDGTLSLIYPRRDFGDPDAVDPDARMGFRVAVAPPFGADHVLALESVAEPDTLRAALARIDGTRDAGALWDAVRTSGARIALFPFFTAEGET